MISSRELLTLTELSHWLTTRLQTKERCEDSSIEAQYPLAEPDPDGCNWYGAVCVSLGANAPEEAVLDQVIELVEQARKRFNVTDEYA
jgi:hypothetical protein